MRTKRQIMARLSAIADRQWREAYERGQEKEKFWQKRETMPTDRAHYRVSFPSKRGIIS